MSISSLCLLLCPLIQCVLGSGFYDHRSKLNFHNVSDCCHPKIKYVDTRRCSAITAYHQSSHRVYKGMKLLMIINVLDILTHSIRTSECLQTPTICQQRDTNNTCITKTNTVITQSCPCHQKTNGSCVCLVLLLDAFIPPDARRTNISKARTQSDHTRSPIRAATRTITGRCTTGILR